MIPNGLFSKGDHWEAKYPWIFLEISQTIEQPLCTCGKVQNVTYHGTQTMQECVECTERCF